MNKMEELGVRIWMMMRYVDDARAALPPIKAGWRWQEGSLTYCKRLEQEDSTIGGEQRTREIMGATMNVIEDTLTSLLSQGSSSQEGGYLP